MNKHQIGLNAGIVWHLLHNNERWTYCDLKKASGLSDRDLDAAIGWLAREGKLNIVENAEEKELFEIFNKLQKLSTAKQTARNAHKFWVNHADKLGLEYSTNFTWLI